VHVLQTDGDLFDGQEGQGTGFIYFPKSSKHTVHVFGVLGADDFIVKKEITKYL